jgi:ATP-dependent DNA helicase DinG
MNLTFKDKVISILGSDGVISRTLENYESRPQQLKMAEAICEAIESEKHLIVEAGTGVGKSLAYLAPFIIYATENDRKVIVSTNTKTLQHQLYEKDLPFLKNSLGIDFDYALCLGTENYLCKRRLNSEFNQDLFDTATQRSDAKRIVEWSLITSSGLKSELGFIPIDEVWDKICRESDLCLGNKCSHKNNCFYKNAKRHERSTHILVTNHALFFTNLASGGMVLPEFHAVVFDEGQTLEDVATSYLGYEISNTKIKYLFDSVYNSKTEKGILLKFKNQKDKVNAIEKYLEESRIASMQFFEEISKKFGTKNEVKRIRTKNIIFNYLEEPLSSLADSMKKLLEDVKSEEEEALVRAYVKKCMSLKASLSFILNLADDNYVYWVEVFEKRGGVKYLLFASPIQIAEELNKQLFDKIKPIILTSATLSTNNNFDFIRGRLGIKECGELLLGSPFNYKENVLLYLVKKIADPSDDLEKFQKQALTYIRELIDIMQGRTFILFTSYKMMRTIYDELKLNYKSINLLKQGDQPRYDLLGNFKRNMNAVLLGTNTFWQGVDVPGKALECVVITKLPFSVPDDPMTEARMELIESRNGNPFLEYQIPQAIMMFKQGFGRLIRTKSDRGVVAVLDPRVTTRTYGKSFLNVLPKCRYTSDINDVKNFFNVKVS